MTHHNTVFRHWFDHVLLTLSENSSHQLNNKPQAEIRCPTPGIDTHCPSLMDITRPAFCVWWKYRGEGHVVGLAAGSSH